MAITSLASTPSPMPHSGGGASTPPSSLGLVSPRLTPTTTAGSADSSSSNGDQISASSMPALMTIPPLPPPVTAPVAPPLSDDEDVKKQLFSSFLPIRHLRLRAQEHLSEQNSINKENAFDSSTNAPPPPPTSSPSPTSTTAYQQS